MSNKITKKDRFNQLLEIQEVVKNVDLKEFIQHELELLAKKKSDKLTKTQLENEPLKNILLETLSTLKVPATIDTIQAANPALEPYHNQKISALIRQLVKVQKVERTEVKRKAYFSLIRQEEV